LLTVSEVEFKVPDKLVEETLNTMGEVEAETLSTLADRLAEKKNKKLSNT